MHWKMKVRQNFDNFLSVQDEVISENFIWMSGSTKNNKEGPIDFRIFQQYFE